MDFSSLSGKQLVKGQDARALGPRETDMSSVTCVQSKAGRAALTSLREPRLRTPPRCALWTLPYSPDGGGLGPSVLSGAWAACRGAVLC